MESQIIDKKEIDVSRCLSLSVICLLLGSLGTLHGAQACPELEGASPKGNLSYLQRDRATLTPDCVSRAIYAISLADRQGFERYEDVVGTLISFLDYRLPDESKLSRVVPSNRDPYPASSGLYIVGKTVVPDLIKAIARSTTPDLSRSKAIEVVFTIYSQESLPDAVRILRRAGNAAKDFEESQRLLDAAKKLSNMCRQTPTECRDALYEPDAK